MQIDSASPHLGAMVEGADLAAIVAAQDASALERIRLAVREHIVLLFRGQRLSPPQIVRLGQYFGPLMNLKRPGSNALHIEGLDFIKTISNAKRSDGVPLGDGSNREQDWHSDGAMQELPATYTYFYARQVPPHPPRTEWISMYAVFENLPAKTRGRIEGLEVIHHKYPAGNEFPLPPSLPLDERMSGPRHPLVRLHPETQRPFLYLPHRSDALVVGMSEEGSRELVAGLRDFAAASPCRWGAALEVDDFVIWDNRPALHRRQTWDESFDRVMWHLANVGERPIPYRSPEPLRAAGS